MEGTDETNRLQPFQSSFTTSPTSFSWNVLPPLSPRSESLPNSIPVASPVDELNGHSQSPSIAKTFHRVSSFKSFEGLPPRKGHRRSSSDIPLGFSAMIQSSPQLIPISGQKVLGHLRVENPVKKELNSDENSGEKLGERKSESKDSNELLVKYMNLENIEALHSSGTVDKDSGINANVGDCSDNEVESSVNGNKIPNDVIFSSSIEKREGVKRNAGGEIVPSTRHFRSVSMDSFMGNLNLDDERRKLASNPLDANSLKFSLEFGNGEFSGAELKKIMANDKLAEIALSDPKRAKRILANRQSAARSKERKMRYISELELKVQTLQTEATTLSSQLALLQRESAGLSNQNSELKFRLQAMEQQAQLKDALNEALTAEVQRLKLAATQLSGEIRPSLDGMARQNSMNLHLFSLQN